MCVCACMFCIYIHVCIRVCHSIVPIKNYGIIYVTQNQFICVLSVGSKSSFSNPFLGSVQYMFTMRYVSLTYYLQVNFIMTFKQKKCNSNPRIKE